MGLSIESEQSLVFGSSCGKDSRNLAGLVELEAINDIVAHASHSGDGISLCQRLRRGSGRHLKDITASNDAISGCNADGIRERGLDLGKGPKPIVGSEKLHLGGGNRTEDGEDRTILCRSNTTLVSRYRERGHNTYYDDHEKQFDQRKSILISMTFHNSLKMTEQPDTF